MGFPANPPFCGVLESEIRAFEVEHLPECARSLEESTVDQGMKRQGKIFQTDVLVMGPSSPRTVGINSETVGWIWTVFCSVVYGTFAAMTSMIE